MIIPEHYADVECGEGQSEEYRDKTGIWYLTSPSVDATNLFCEIEASPYLEATKYICLGDYYFIIK